MERTEAVLYTGAVLWCIQDVVEGSRYVCPKARHGSHKPITAAIVHACGIRLLSI